MSSSAQKNDSSLILFEDVSPTSYLSPLMAYTIKGKQTQSSIAGSLLSERISVEASTTVASDIIRNASVAASNEDGVFESKIIIPLYVTIFLLSVLGNATVLFTLFRNKRMRTVTNVYLVNLAIADLLLGVLCMPFTLIGQLLRRFIFGAFMCKLIPYSQAVSVSVAVWTLVAISLERYFAICRPLKSRRWQTQFHAYKMICFVWMASLLWCTPVLIVSTLSAMKSKGTFKCREMWPSKASERAFSLFLDGILLVIPLVIMSLAYSLIISKLWKGLQKEIEHNNSFQQINQNTVELKDVNKKQKEALLNGSASHHHRHHHNGVASRSQRKILHTNVKLIKANRHQCCSEKKHFSNCSSSVIQCIKSRIKQVTLSKPCYDKNYTKTATTLVTSCSSSAGHTTKAEITFTHPSCTCVPSQDQSGVAKSMENGGRYEEAALKRLPIRSNYMDKSIEAKKKVIRMLFVIVLEFFICWTPIHILNTMYLYYPDKVYNIVGRTGISLVQLLAFISSCCNPITYCFMNRKFRQSFLSIFCSKRFCCCCLCCGSSHQFQAKLNGAVTAVQINNGKVKIVQNSEGSVNDSTLYPGKASTGRSAEVVVLEGEERV